MFQICQSRLIILSNKKYPVKKLPKTFKILQKWRNFGKTGHTGQKSLPHVVAAIPVVGITIFYKKAATQKIGQ